MRTKPAYVTAPLLRTKMTASLLVPEGEVVNVSTCLHAAPPASKASKSPPPLHHTRAFSKTTFAQLSCNGDKSFSNELLKLNNRYVVVVGTEEHLQKLCGQAASSIGAGEWRLLSVRGVFHDDEDACKDDVRVVEDATKWPTDAFVKEALKLPKQLSRP